VEAFSAMLFIAYTAFNVFSYLYKDTLLPPGLAAQEDSGLPPAQFGGGAGYGADSTSFGAGGDAPAYRDEPAGAPATVL